jgi:hypothetical protein
MKIHISRATDNSLPEPTYEKPQSPSRMNILLSTLFRFPNYGDLTEAQKTIEDLRRQLSVAQFTIEMEKEDRSEERKLRRKKFESFLACNTPLPNDPNHIKRIIAESQESRKKFASEMKEIEESIASIKLSKLESLATKEFQEDPHERFRRIMKESELAQKRARTTLEDVENAERRFIEPISSAIRDLICWVESCFISSGIKNLISWTKSFFIKS